MLHISLKQFTFYGLYSYHILIFFPPTLCCFCDCGPQTILYLLLFEEYFWFWPITTPTKQKMKTSGLLPSLSASLSCGSALDVGLLAVPLTFFTASDFLLSKPCPPSHVIRILHYAICLCLEDFLLPNLPVCHPGENSVGGGEVCK